MTLSTTTNRIDYAGDGATTAFTIPFPFLSDADISVIHRDGSGSETQWVLGTEYSVAGAGEDAGTLNVSTSPVDHTPTAGETLVIRRVVSETQPTLYPAGGSFPAAAHEQSLDRLTMIAQQHSEALAHRLAFPILEGASISSELPAALLRAGKYLGFDNDGAPITLDPPAGTTSLSSFGSSLVMASDAGAVRTLLDITPRNQLVNGDFQVWQRGTSKTINSAEYVADRWRCDVGDGGTPGATIRRGIFAPGQNDVPNALNFLDWEQTAAAVTTGPALQQRVPYVGRFAGRHVTVSLWCRVAAGAVSSVNVRALQDFGTGGAPSADVEVVLGSFNPTSQWQRFAITGNIPGVDGKTIGTNENDFSQISLSLPTASTFRLEFAQIQLEFGDGALAFEERSFESQKSDCEFFYQRWDGDGVRIGTGAASTTTDALVGLPMHRAMYRTPALEYSDVLDLRALSTGVAVSSIGETAISRTAAAATFTAAAPSWAAGWAVELFINGATGFVALNAEI